MAKRRWVLWSGWKRFELDPAATWEVAAILLLLRTKAHQLPGNDGPDVFHLKLEIRLTAVKNKK
jgi:hypothetical protein